MALRACKAGGKHYFKACGKVRPRAVKCRITLLHASGNIALPTLDTQITIKILRKIGIL